MLSRSQLHSLFTLIADDSKTINLLVSGFQKLFPQKSDVFRACSVLNLVLADSYIPTNVRLGALSVLGLHTQTVSGKTRTLPPHTANPFLGTVCACGALGGPALRSDGLADAVISASTSALAFHPSMIDEGQRTNVPTVSPVNTNDPPTVEQLFARAIIDGTLIKEKTIAEVLSGVKFVAKKNNNESISPQSLLSAQNTACATLNTAQIFAHKKELDRLARSVFVPIPDYDDPNIDVVRSLTDMFSSLPSLSSAFSPTWVRIPPLLYETEPSELSWPLPDPDFELLWDTTLLTRPPCPPEQLALVNEALTSTLSQERAAAFELLLQKDLTFLFTSGIDAENFCQLVERNPSCAFHFLISVRENDPRGLYGYLETITSSKPTLAVFEFVILLGNKHFPLPESFYIKFVSSCVQKCPDNATARRISQFTLPLVRPGGTLDPRRCPDLCAELRTFAFEYLSVREVSDLFNAIQTYSAANAASSDGSNANSIPNLTMGTGMSQTQT